MRTPSGSEGKRATNHGRLGGRGEKESGRQARGHHAVSRISRLRPTHGAGWKREFRGERTHGCHSTPRSRDRRGSYRARASWRWGGRPHEDVDAPGPEPLRGVGREDGADRPHRARAAGAAVSGARWRSRQGAPSLQLGASESLGRLRPRKPDAPCGWTPRVIIACWRSRFISPAIPPWSST
jgi:hypothetical protein